MKKNYIPQNQRKKILLLSDDIRTQSGVGNQAKEIVLNTAHHFNWVNLGGAVNHPDHGKGFDLSPDINKIAGLEDSYVKVNILEPLLMILEASLATSVPASLPNALPIVLNEVPNIRSYSENEVTTVGTRAGPFTVGPINAAPISPTAAGKKL